MCIYMLLAGACGYGDYGRTVNYGRVAGVAGLWRGLSASMVLVVNPSITYGAYERLHAVVFPNKTRLAPHEAFGE